GRSNALPPLAGGGGSSKLNPASPPAGFAGAPPGDGRSNEGDDIWSPPDGMTKSSSSPFPFAAGAAGVNAGAGVAGGGGKSGDMAVWSASCDAGFSQSA